MRYDQLLTDDFETAPRLRIGRSSRPRKSDIRRVRRSLRKLHLSPRQWDGWYSPGGSRGKHAA